jgi:hypothetical protein
MIVRHRGTLHPHPRVSGDVGWTIVSAVFDQLPPGMKGEAAGEGRDRPERAPATAPAR